MNHYANIVAAIAAWPAHVLREFRHSLGHCKKCNGQSQEKKKNFVSLFVGARSSDCRNSVEMRDVPPNVQNAVTLPPLTPVAGEHGSVS